MVIISYVQSESHLTENVGSVLLHYGLKYCLTLNGVVIHFSCGALIFTLSNALVGAALYIIH